MFGAVAAAARRARSMRDYPALRATERWLRTNRGLRVRGLRVALRAGRSSACVKGKRVFALELRDRAWPDQNAAIEARAPGHPTARARLVTDSRLLAIDGLRAVSVGF